MPDFAAYAVELDALVRDGRRIRLGDRCVEQPYERLDALLHELGRLAARMRVGAPAEVRAANDGPALPASVVTGRGQVLVSRAGRRPADFDPPRDAPGLRVLRVVR